MQLLRVLVAGDDVLVRLARAGEDHESLVDLAGALGGQQSLGLRHVQGMLGEAWIARSPDHADLDAVDLDEPEVTADPDEGRVSVDAAKKLGAVIHFAFVGLEDSKRMPSGTPNLNWFPSIDSLGHSYVPVDKVVTLPTSWLGRGIVVGRRPWRWGSFRPSDWGAPTGNRSSS